MDDVVNNEAQSLVDEIIDELISSESETGDEKFDKALKKLLDMYLSSLDITNLSISQAISDYETRNKESNRVINEQIENQEGKLLELDRQMSDAVSQTMTIIGIFIAILMVSFGGVSLISNIISILEHPPSFTVTLLIILIAMINLLFFFIYLVAKLSSKDIGVECHNHTPIKNEKTSSLIHIQKNCINCVKCDTTKGCNYFKRIWRRYPYILLVNILLFLSIVGASLWLYNSPNDTTPPSITLHGNNPLTITVGTDYIEEGAIAFDEHDGDITRRIKITGIVDKDIVGTYYLHYNVKDKASNSALTVIRIINVVVP